jgi:hypothetical protein
MDAGAAPFLGRKGSRQDVHVFGRAALGVIKLIQTFGRSLKMGF